MNICSKLESPKLVSENVFDEHCARCLKITEKVSFNILDGQLDIVSSLKMSKKVNFASFFFKREGYDQTVLPDGRQVSFISTKLVGNLKKDEKF